MQLRILSERQVSLKNIARHAEDQCKIDFQPVSGQATRHPQKVVSREVRNCLPSILSVKQRDRLEAYPTLRFG